MTKCIVGASLVAATLATAAPALGQTPASPPMIKGDKDQIAYGDRSRFVTSVRIDTRLAPFVRGPWVTPGPGR